MKQTERLFSPGDGKPRLTLRQAVKLSWNKYVDFDTRARRSEFWWFCLTALLAVIAPLLLFAAIPDVLDAETHVIEVLRFLPGFLLLLVLGVAVLMLFSPLMAVLTRRLHDVGRSGWWIVWDIVLTCASSMFISTSYSLCGLGHASAGHGNLGMLKELCHVSWPLFAVGLVFYLAAVALTVTIFVFTLMDSRRGKNKYGPSPKYPL